MQPVPEPGGRVDSRTVARSAREIGFFADWTATPGWGALLIAGPDATSFLHTQLTSDIAHLEAGNCQASARLTRSGGLLAHGTVYRLPERGQPFASFLMLLPQAEIPSLLEDLEASRISENLLLEVATDQFAGLLLQGPQVSAMRAALEPIPGALWIENSWTGDPGGLLLAPSLDDSVASAARRAGLVDLDRCDAGEEVWRWLLLEAGTPRAGFDFQPGRTLLPATGLEQSTVSWTKGCYRGQEVVARIRTYGSVPRALRGLLLHEPIHLTPDQVPVAGEALLTVEDEKIGSWASAGYSAQHDKVVALAYLDRDHRRSGDRLQLQAGDLDLEAEVVPLPLHAAAHDGERAASLHRRALRIFHEGEDRRAASMLEEAIRLDPQLADAYEALGVILGRAERYHEAIDVFQRLAEVAPHEPMVSTNLSLFYMKIGDKEEAERQKAQATLMRFGGEESVEERAIREAEAASHRRADAERRQTMFSEVLAADPRDGLALMGLGNALLDLDNFAAAEEHLQRALEVQPQNSALYVSRGKVLERLDREAEALDVYRRGIEVASRKGDLLPLKELEHRLFVLESTTD